jgi:formylglycine-generating enzyme required for sulfatase activity
MMEAPRRALSGFVLAAFFACVFPSAAPQDAGKDQAKAIASEIKKVDEKIKEEGDRVAKKKEALQLEFAALGRPEAKSALQAKLVEIGNKHKGAFKPAKPGPDSKGADTRPRAPDSVRNAIQEEARAALAGTVGRNLSTVMDKTLADNLVVVLGDGGQVDYKALLEDTITEIFTGTDFESNYRKLIPTFEKKLIDLREELAALKQKLADLEAGATGKTTGAPPGMVLVPGGKVRIGIDDKEYAAIKKAVGYGPNDHFDLDMYALGWPPHEVDLEPFFIDVNEVTCRQWSEFIRDTQRKAPKNWARKDEKKAESRANGTPAPEPAPASRPAGADDYTPPPDMLDLPVTMITYEEVELFCAWCGRRPPTEFEWEAAARARSPGETGARWWPFGDVYDRRSAQCNNQTAVTHPLRQNRQLAPIGSFPLDKSALGILDLGGNVLEMTSSQFLAYPKWVEAKCPSQKQGKDPHSGSLLVLRGGSAAAPELYSLTSTRKAMTVKAADLVGFRTVLSKSKGKDFVMSVAGDQQLAPALATIGTALRDEKSGRAELATNDPSRFWVGQAGGWDPARNVPARASYIGVLARNTSEFTDPSKLKTLSREQKKPLMIGWFTSAVDFTNPEIPKGNYWILWDPGRSRGKDKVATSEGLVLQSTADADKFYEIRNVSPVLVPRSSEPTKLTAEKDGSLLNVLLTFPVRDRKESRFIVELRLETAPGALKAFNFK